MSGARTTYHHGNLRSELVDAATELLRQVSDEELTLRAVARAAGVSQTAPYRHFSDKGALLAAVAETGFSKLDGRCRRVLASTKEPRERLRRLGAAYVKFALDEPALYRLMFGAQLGPFKDEYPMLAKGARQVHGMMRRAVEQTVAGAAGTAGDIEAACMAAWSLVHGLASLLIDRNIRTSRRETAAMIDRVTGLFAGSLA